MVNHVSPDGDGGEIIDFVTPSSDDGDFVVLVGGEHGVGNSFDLPFVNKAELFGQAVVSLEVGTDLQGPAAADGVMEGGFLSGVAGVQAMDVGDGRHCCLLELLYAAKVLRFKK